MGFVCWGRTGRVLGRSRAGRLIGGDQRLVPQPHVSFSWVHLTCTQDTFPSLIFPTGLIFLATHSCVFYLRTSYLCTSLRHGFITPWRVFLAEGSGEAGRWHRNPRCCPTSYKRVARVLQPLASELRQTRGDATTSQWEVATGMGSATTGAQQAASDTTASFNLVGHHAGDRDLVRGVLQPWW